MVLVCYVILEDHVIKWSRDFMVRSLMVSQHPAKCGGHRHHGDNIPANMVILPQMWVIRECICPGHNLN